MCVSETPGIQKKALLALRESKYSKHEVKSFTTFLPPTSGDRFTQSLNLRKPSQSHHHVQHDAKHAFKIKV